MSVIPEPLVLPDRASAGPSEVHFGSLHLQVTFVRESVWDIAERVGQTLVHHGRLTLQGGRFFVSTATGVETSALRWHQALRQHFHIR